MKHCFSIFFILFFASLLSGCKSETKKNGFTQDVIIHDIGKWHIVDDTNEFGEKNGYKYLQILGDGIFSNYAATNENAAISMNYFSDNTVLFRIANYGNQVLKDEILFNGKIKDSEGIVYDLEMFNSQHGNFMFLDWESDSATIINAIRKEGVLSIYIHDEDKDSPTEYTFKIDLTGLGNALKMLEKTN